MAELIWDQTGQRFFETGVDHGVLYLPDASGDYSEGYAWNGLTAVTETPSGAEATPTYADNIKYLNLVSLEEFGGTIEAYTYPDEFAQCDGTVEQTAGVFIGQQPRSTFGLSYRTRKGNDVDHADHGYKLHLVWGALASPSERAYSTINDSPEAMSLSWEFSTTAVPFPESMGLKPTALITIDSTQVSPAALETLEDFLYGTAGSDPSLPSPAAVVAIFEGTVTEVVPNAPTYNSTTDLITIPSQTGVVYKIDGETVTGTVAITEDTVVNAYPATGYQFPEVVQDEWFFEFV